MVNSHYAQYQLGFGITSEDMADNLAFSVCTAAEEIRYVFDVFDDNSKIIFVESS